MELGQKPQRCKVSFLDVVAYSTVFITTTAMKFFRKLFGHKHVPVLQLSNFKQKVPKVEIVCDSCGELTNLKAAR